MKNLTIEEHGYFYSKIGRGGLGLEFNYSKDYTAYIVIKENENHLDIIKSIESITDGILTGVTFKHENRKAVSGTMSGSYLDGTKSTWIKVIRK